MSESATATGAAKKTRGILLARDVSQVTAIECESAEIQGVRRRQALSDRPRLSRVRLAKGKRGNVQARQIGEARAIPTE